MKNPSLRERLAPTRNNRLVTAKEAPTTALTRSGKIAKVSGDTVLQRFRSEIAYLEAIDFGALDDKFESWEAIQEQSIDIFDTHIDARTTELGPGPIGYVKHASIAGVGTVGAFLRVIPQVQGTDIDREAIVHNSVRTLFDWAAISEQAESDLSTLVCDPKPNLKLPPRSYNVGLTFAPQFFTVNQNPENGNRWVDINYSYIESLGKEAVKSINRQVHGAEVFYGCPFRVDIPKLYNAMAQAAFRSELL